MSPHARTATWASTPTLQGTQERRRQRRALRVPRARQPLPRAAARRLTACARAALRGRRVVTVSSARRASTRPVSAMAYATSVPLVSTSTPRAAQRSRRAKTAPPTRRHLPRASPRLPARVSTATPRRAAPVRSARRASMGTPRARVLLVCAVSIQKRAAPRPTPRVSSAPWASIQTCSERRASARAKTAPLPPSRRPAARPWMLALQVCFPFFVSHGVGGSVYTHMQEAEGGSVGVVSSLPLMCQFMYPSPHMTCMVQCRPTSLPPSHAHVHVSVLRQICVRTITRHRGPDA